MSRRTTAPFALGMLALGLAAATAAAPAARADGSEGMGTQIMAEMMRAQAIRSDTSGWRNGMPTLVTTGSGGGYSVVYAGMPSGDAGMGGTVMVTGNSDGNPMVERQQQAMPSQMLAMAR